MFRRHWQKRGFMGLIVVSIFLVHMVMIRSLVRDDSTGTRPRILIWHPPFGQINDYVADRPTCGGRVECDIAYDRSLLGESEAVVFHFRSTSMETMPPKRDPQQLYVWWSGEKSHNLNLKAFDDFFNLTFTYRRDSEVFAPYGSTNIILEELRKENGPSVEALIAKKRKSRKNAAWAVSNCGVQSRMKLAQDIMDAGFDVDTFGRCFNDREIGDGENSKSFYEALSEYKFYFAFENGYHCKDYITEKFWYNGLKSGAVPIVWGPTKEDVAAVAPKHSFIHVDDFDNVSDLVDHLFYLSSNETAYKEYHQWRTWLTKPALMEERFRVFEGKELHSFCKLCKILQDRQYSLKRGVKPETLIVPSLNEWWIKKESFECVHSELFDLKMPQDGVKEFLADILHRSL